MNPFKNLLYLFFPFPFAGWDLAGSDAINPELESSFDLCCESCFESVKVNFGFESISEASLESSLESVSRESELRSSNTAFSFGAFSLLSFVTKTGFSKFHFLDKNMIFDTVCNGFTYVVKSLLSGEEKRVINGRFLTFSNF